jgi:hypothetical protein
VRTRFERHLPVALSSLVFSVFLSLVGAAVALAGNGGTNYP